MAVLSGVIASGRQMYQGQPPATQTIATPTTAPTLAASGTGATLPAATYYAKYTWVGASGETSASPESTGQVVTSGQTLTVTVPGLPAGATSANIYISSSTGAETKQGNTASTTFSQGAPLVTGVVPPAFNATGATALYTAPNYSTNVTSTTQGTSASSGSVGSSTAYIKEINITNTSSSTATYSLFIVPSGSVASAGNAYHYNISVAAGDTKTLSGLNVMMPANSMLQGAQSTAGALSVTVSGTEVQ